MKREKLTGKVPPLKRRAGVMPTKKERDKSRDHERQAKHRQWAFGLDAISQD